MKSNIPELRFSEFKNEPEWEEKTLSDISDFINEKISLNKLTLNNYISTENLLQDFSGVAISSKLPDVKTVTHFKKNDILISNIRPYLKKVWSATFDGGASNDVIVVRAKENTNNNFLTYVLKNEKFISYIMEGAKGVKMPRGDISLIKKYPLSISPKPKEQQKIADCLSSLDNLITAQSKKVGALKEHKKGLMQQLFPQDGEKVPKLRFPEFKNAPKWEEKTLGGISQILRGGSPRPIESYLTTNADGLNWLKIGDINKDSKYVVQTQEKVLPTALSKTREVNPGDLILSNSMSFGRPYILKIKACIHDGWIAITKIDKKFDRDYLYYFISSDASQTYFLNNAAGAAVLNLNAEIIKLLPIFAPKIDEQQKIADCLSSIDELITSSAKKVDILKEHKKGLMQKLFPNLKE